MSSENLLVNVDVDATPATKKVGELNKRLAENGKQAAKMQEELHRLEKEYKSIATATGKIKGKELSQLSVQVKENDKVVRALGSQMERTTQKMEKIKDRAMSATDGFVALSAAVVAVGRLDTFIRLADRVSKASNAILLLEKSVKPAIESIIRLGQKGFERTASAATSFFNSLLLIGPALREQLHLLQGNHMVLVRGPQLYKTLRDSIVLAGRGANYFYRSLVDLREFLSSTGDSISRVRRLLTTVADGARLGGKAFSEMGAAVGSAMASGFGASSVGAARLPWWRIQLLILGDEFDQFAKKASKGWKNFGEAALDAAKRLAVFTGGLLKVVSVRGLDFLREAAEKLGPVFAKLGTDSLGFFQGLYKLAGGALKSVGAAISGTASKVVEFVGDFRAGRVSVAAFTEGLSIAGFGLIGLGSILKITDSAFLDFIGTAVQFAGVVSLSMGTALSVVTQAVGVFMAKAGLKLIEVMNTWEDKFVKAQQATQAFEFTVTGFAKKLGEAAVGSVEGWGRAIDKLRENTAFGSSEIQKAIKVIIAEGSALGLSAEQNATILQRATDVAAANGRELPDIAQAIVNALAGQGQALQALGVFTDDSTLQHSKWAEAQGLTVTTLDKSARALLAYNVILDSTSPLAGAATAQLSTMAGATKQYEAAVSSLQAKLGEQNFFTIKLQQAMSVLAVMLNGIPQPVLSFVGALVDLSGVLLVVVGGFITVSVSLVSATTLMAALNSVLLKGGLIAEGLGWVLTKLATQVGVTNVSVAGLNATLMTMGRIAVASVVQGLRSIILATRAYVVEALVVIKTQVAQRASMLLTVAGWRAMAVATLTATKSVAAFTATVLASPIFKAAVFLAAILAAVEAFQQLSEQLTRIERDLGLVNKKGQDGESVFKKLLYAIQVVVQAIIDLFKLALIGFTAAWRGIEYGTLSLKKLWAQSFGNPKDVEGINKALADTTLQMKALGIAAKETFGIQKIEDFKRAIEAVAEALDFSKKARITNDQLGAIRLDILGSEFDKLNANVRTTKELLGELQKFGVIKVGTEIIMPTKENIAAMDRGELDKDGKQATRDFAPNSVLNEAAVNVAKAEIALVKAQRDAYKDLAKTIREGSIETLRNRGNELEAIREQYELDKKSLALVNEELKRGLGSGPEVLAMIKATEDALRSRFLWQQKTAETTSVENFNTKLKAQVALLDALNEKSAEYSIANLRAMGDLAAAIDIEANQRIDGIKKFGKSVFAVQDIAERLGIDFEKLKERIAAVVKESTRIALMEASFEKLAATLRELGIETGSFGEDLSTRVFKSLNAVNQMISTGVFADIGKGMNSTLQEAAGWLNTLPDGLAKGMGQGLGEFISGAGNNIEEWMGGFKNISQTFIRELAADGAKMVSSFAGAGEVMGKYIGMGAGVVGEVIGRAFGQSGTQFGKVLTGVLSLGGKIMGKAIDTIGPLVVGIFDPEKINKIADFFGEFINKLPSALQKAWSKLGAVLEGFIKNFPKALDSVLNMLPGLIQKVLDKLPQVLEGLMNGLVKVFDRLPFIFGRILASLPNLIATFMKMLPSVISSLFSAIGLIVSQLIMSIPDILKEIMEGLPGVVLAIVEGFIAAVGDIVSVIINEFLLGGGLEKIVAAFLRMIPRIVVAFVQGVLRGLSRGLQSIWKGTNLAEPLQKVGEYFQQGVQNLAKKATDDANKVFKVLELEGKARALSEIDKFKDTLDYAIEAFTIRWKGLMQHLREAWLTIMKWWDEIVNAWYQLWDWFFEAMGKLFKWLVDKVFQPVADAISAIFTFVFEKIVNPILNGIQEAGEKFKELFSKFPEAVQAAFTFFKVEIHDKFAASIQAAWDWFKLNILDKFASGITTVFTKAKTEVLDPLLTAGAGIVSTVKAAFTVEFWKGFGTSIFNGLKAGIDNASSLFSGLGDQVWEGLESGLGGIGDIIKGQLEKLDPGNVLGKMFAFDSGGMGDVENALSKIAGGNFDVPFTAFAKGGLVPGEAAVKGDSLLNDRILALLSPGEAVIPRSMMANPAVRSVVDAILSGVIKPRKYGIGGKIGGVIEDIGDSVPVPELPPIPGIPGLPSPEEMWGIFKDKALSSLMDMVRNATFHQGGLVPGFAGGGEVPAMLQSGEYVINRQAVQSLGLGALNRMNQGAASGDSTYNFDIKLNVSAAGLPDEAFVRQRLIPAVKKELKDSSMRGEFLLSSKGIRST